MRLVLLSEVRNLRRTVNPFFRPGRGQFPSLSFLCALIFLAAAAYAQKPDELKYTGYVNDFAGVLSPGMKARLTALCTEVDQKTQAQIAVVTIKTTGGEPIEEFSNELFQKWGVGPKESKRGILILLAVDDHKDRFETGYGLEPILPDGKTGGFGREAVPLLRAGNYDAAVYLMTRRVADVIAQDKGVTLTSATALPMQRSRRGQGGSIGPIGVLALFAIVWFVFSILSRMGPGSGYTRRRGGGGWWIGPFIGGGFGGGGWGGGGGFGGGGGGGFGGFGGGSSGGGGSTGSW